MKKEGVVEEGRGNELKEDVLYRLASLLPHDLC